MVGLLCYIHELELNAGNEIVRLQGCSGLGTRGNGVPKPFSRFVKNVLQALSNRLFFGCVPI